MKAKPILTSKLDAAESPTEMPLVVGRPEPLHPLPPKERTLENQAYLRKININRPIIYAGGQSDSPLDSERSVKKRKPAIGRKLRKARMASPREESPTEFTKHCEKLESQRLEELHFELFPTELNESLVRLPDVQYTHFQPEYLAELPKPLPVPTKSKSPPTLGNLLKTANRRRGRVNFSNILDNKFHDYLSQTSCRRPSRDLEYYRTRISKAKQLKEDFLSLYA